MFWIPSIRRILLGVATYVVAVILRDVPDADAKMVYGIAGAVVLIILATDEYFSSVRPAKRIEELAPIALDGLAEPLLTQLENNQVAARINLMMPVRTWRWMGLVRYFKMRWSKGMANQPDVNISFRLHQGITGACFKSRRPIYADRAQILSPQFALPQKIRKHAPDLEAIFSYPVYEPARKGRLQSGRLLGVLNLDSTSARAYNILTVSPVFDEVHTAMQNIAMVRGALLRIEKGGKMPDEKNIEIVKLANGLYTIRDYHQPKEVPTSDLRKIAEATRNIQIRIPSDDTHKPD